MKTSRHRARSLSVCAGLAAALLPIGVIAQDAPMAPAVAAKAPETKGRITPAAQAVAQVAMANSLIQYGRSSKAPAALITAAQILAENQMAAAGDKPGAKTPGAGMAGGKKGRVMSSDPAALLAEAKSMSGNDPSIVALANKAARTMGRTRGRIGGASLHSDRVAAHGTDEWTISFRAGEEAEVGLKGDGTTDVDVHVYDSDGNLVAYDDDDGDVCLAKWVPTYSGQFSIHVINRSGVYNDYTMVTN